MSRRKIWIVVAVVLALNVMMILMRTRNNPKWTALQADVRAGGSQHLTIQEIRSGYRAAPALINYEPLDLIGTLAQSSSWTQTLHLAKGQAGEITKLDDLVRSARAQSWLADLDYLNGNPPSYREYAASSNARRKEATLHAQRMVALGLLTKPQAALVIQRVLSGRPARNVLYNEHVQELLGMSKSQKAMLLELTEKSRSTPVPMNAFSVNREEQKQLGATYDTVEQQYNSRAMGILTPSQLDRWSRLAAERSLPAEPPDLPALTAADAARIKIEDVSPTFRALVEKAAALGLSSDQKKLLQDLQDVMQHGLLWIGLRNHVGPTVSTDVGKEPADRVSQTRAEFVKHAEQVALLGILTQRQAEQLQSAIKKN